MFVKSCLLLENGNKKLRRVSDDLVLSETILGNIFNVSVASKDANVSQTSISVMKIVSEHFSWRETQI